ncbi:WXG100 family type VII secretion target [Butyrivibrio sp. ob235]|uniref:WXG100 family type VII secretion target n=1 Tax=Butyrivibrio sp. ob235 TaxID=1761780 RepID=UPI0008C7B5D2|nr:WXG100 family type VII secretion target [Butyrivibrio sp. ob235]SEM28463.1 WXG100 family type VII secretion target [Butyrivibrio sp. ob235]
MATKNTVNIQKMMSAATELDNIHASMTKQIKKLDETMSSIKQVWSGEAATTYLKQYDKNYTAFQNMAKAIRGASDALTENCNTYNQADSKAMDIVQKLSHRG